MDTAMKYTKKQNKVVQLDNKERKTPLESTSEKKKDEQLINFDLYFQLLMKREPRILAHHKAPMRKFAEQNKITEATIEEFDKVFKLY